MNELEKKAEELSSEIKAAKEAAAVAQARYDELKAKNDATDAELKAAQENLGKAQSDIKSLSDAMNELNTKMAAIQAQAESKSEPAPSLRDELSELFQSEQFKSAFAKNKGKNREWSENYELKASTADIVTPVMNTQMLPGVQFGRSRSLAILPNLVQGTVGQDKNRITYISGKYVSNVGYVGEGQANSKDDTISATEKTVQMAKFSAKMPVTTEMFEDVDFIMSQLKTQMVDKTLLYVDREAYSGDGDDSSNPRHIYGLWGAATAFSAAKAGVAAAIETPHVGDLVGAIKVQAQVIDAADDTKKDDGGYNIDTLFINPVDAMKWRHTKTPDGNYVLSTLADGSQVMGGVRAIETKVVKANTLLAMESGLAQFFIKRNLELKIGQEKDDLSADRYTIVLFMRAQQLIYENDKLGIIKVDDITAALEAIAKPAAAAEKDEL